MIPFFLSRILSMVTREKQGDKQGGKYMEIKIKLNQNHPMERQLSNALPSLLSAQSMEKKNHKNNSSVMASKKEEKNAAKPAAQSTSEEEEKTERLQEIYQEIDQLIGLTQVKKLILEIQAFIKMQTLRQNIGLKHDPIVLHAIFRGNPGSGKTTMARLFGRLLKELGVLSKGHLLEVERADLVGEYIGHTAKKAKEQIKNAQGGVLFIDEAYSLARGGNKDFGREAIDALVKGMEDQRENFVLILAGYQEEMKHFLATNPGLNSRFPLHIDFPDYSLQELAAIAENMYTARDYILTPNAKRQLLQLLEDTIRRYPKYHGNGRLSRNIVETSLRKQAIRLNQELAENTSEMTPAEYRKILMEILPIDLQIDTSLMITKPEKSEEENIADLGKYLKRLAEG